MNHRFTLTARLRRLTAVVESPRLEPVLFWRSAAPWPWASTWPVP
ncbi:hypothetical protein [Streptomyces platensis]